MSGEGHHPAPMSAVEQRVAALEALLTERGLVPEGFIEEITRASQLKTRRRHGEGEAARTTG